MHHLQWSVISVIFVILVSLTSASQCPEGPNCSACQGPINEEYEIQCSTSKSNSMFIVKFKPNEWIEITCYHSPNWSEFYLGTVQKIQHARAISFRMCTLPKEIKLSDIVKQIVGNDIQELKFQSYDNLTSTLTRDSLSDFKNVQRLTLSSNSLTNVTFDLFHDLENLKMLNLLQNQIRELPEKFLNLSNLEAIELGSNQLEVIQSSAFENLENLKLLNIWNNKLVEIKAKSFDKLKSLTHIDIHQNKLRKLPDSLFAHLKNLKSINLAQNNFTWSSLPEDLFKNTSKLESVTFFENKKNLTTLPSGFFANLTNLVIVKMKRNGLIYLPENLFVGTGNLRNLSLERNYLITLPPKIFEDCKNLSTIDLSFNELVELPDGVFTNLNKLELLDLSKNHMETINNNVFNGLSSLKVLNLERNQLKVIHTYGLRSLRNLRIAKLSYNKLTLKPAGIAIIDEFGPSSPFHHCIETIEELHLAHNNISDIFGDWILARHLRTLSLQHNDMRVLQTSDLQFIADNLNVDLSFNKIESILLQDAEIISETNLTYPKNVIITVGNNPLNCDCNIYDLLRYREGKMHPNVQNRFHLNLTNLRCNEPSLFANINVEMLKSQSLKCRVENPEDYNATCPRDCSCFIHPDTKAYIIDCSFKSLREAPKFLRGPPGFPIELNLMGNFITTMPLISQSGYHAVKILSLSHNHINNVNLKSFSKTLEVLKLDWNNLTRLEPPILDFLRSSNLRNLTLEGNPWICDCEAREFLNYLQNQSVKNPELQKVRCDVSGPRIFEMTADELCPLVIGWIIGVSIGVAILGIIIGILAALYYRYQDEIKVWLYARQWCLWFVTEDELDKDKLYDAFISYSHKDEEFVVNNLVPKLEEGDNPFKLCIHYRDWMAGEWIPTQIARSVEDSRRTIVVVSPNFLESIWGRMEFRTAHNQALSEGRARVIVILYGEIGPIDQLDAELKAYLSMNTYVKWGDPWFWEKLRYALPHSGRIVKRKTPTVYQTQHPTIHIPNDKSELIGDKENGSQLIASTPPADTYKSLVIDEKEEEKNLSNDAQTKESTKVNAKILTLNDSIKSNVKINMLQCTTV